MLDYIPVRSAGIVHKSESQRPTKLRELIRGVTGIKPNYDKLRIFGMRAYASQPKILSLS